MTARRRLLAAGLAALLLPAAQAQSDWRREAVPFYTPPDFVQGQRTGWYAPRSRAFAAQAARLTAALRSHCQGSGSAADARRAWLDALGAWSALSGVAGGPLIERRSARQIDFQPVRPALIAAAIARAPTGAAEMERVGSPAKGLPALEWLLWTQPAAPGTPACDYAGEVAADLQREADALAAGFAATQAADAGDEATVAAMAEAINQWVGGLELLRLQTVERALRAAPGKGGAGRAASGALGLERAARWQALRSLAVLGAPPAPAPGAGLVPLETYLRGKGLNPLADRLVRATRDADAALAGPRPRLADAARRLATLKSLVEAQVAPALDIRIGFSDADGD